MTLTFTTSRQAAQLHGIKICVHGRAGTGKTTLISTLPSPIILSAESGMLALADFDIPTIIIRTMAEMDEAYQYLMYDADAKKRFHSVALDSISEIAEACLNAEKIINKDGRAAYGAMNEQMTKLIKQFRDMPNKHIYFSAKQGKATDEVTNVTRYGPDMPGRMLTNNMPYLFDEVFSLEIGITAEGQEFRYLRTKTSIQHEAKDRSGFLEQFEEPNLGNVINKILAATQGGTV